MTALRTIRDHILLTFSDWFDESWYLRQYPDVASSGTDPVAHYLAFGALEERDPGPSFSTRAYLEENRDVAASRLNPLVHFLRHGIQEGRTPRASEISQGPVIEGIPVIGEDDRGAARASIDGASVRTIGIVIKNGASPPPTAFIRVLLPWREISRSAPYRPIIIDAVRLLAADVASFDAVVIQRDAIAPRVVPDVIDNLRERGVPYLFEIDDLLWDLPGDHPDRAEYEGSKSSIVLLMRHARMVSTSTENLRSEISRHNLSSMVVPNSSWFECWEKPIDSRLADEVRRAHGLDPDRPRILYMGSASHALDVEMVAPAIAAVTRARPDVDVVQVGGGRLAPSARAIAVPARFRAYEEFVQWFRIVAGGSSIGIAPLRGTRFDSMKSDIKALDYARAGLPAIFSDVEPYRGSVIHGQTGLLVGNSSDSWTAAILGLLDDEPARAHLVTGAEQWASGRSHEARAALEQFMREALGRNL